VVGALYRYQKTLKASLVKPADIVLRDIMATRENSISDSSQVDLNIFCPDVRPARPRNQEFRASSIIRK
jgi:hypothetical protein